MVHYIHGRAQYNGHLFWPDRCINAIYRVLADITTSYVEACSTFGKQQINQIPCHDLVTEDVAGMWLVYSRWIVWVGSTVAGKLSGNINMLTRQKIYDTFKK